MENQQSHLLLQTAEDHFEQGRYLAARPLYEQALTLATAQTQTLAPYYFGLGRLLYLLGDFSAAQTHLEQALAWSFTVPEPNAPQMVTLRASIQHQLGEVYFDQGNFDQGQNLTQTAYQTRQQHLGDDHADTLESLKNMALQLSFKGQLETAEQLLTQALTTAERLWGDSHQITAKILNALGVIWRKNQAMRAKALAAHQRALHINEQLKGADDPYNTVCLTNIGDEYVHQGKPETALTIYERALTLTKTAFGEQNFRVALTLSSLAHLYEQQARQPEARQALEQALIITERGLGADHFLTLKALRELTTFLGNQMSTDPTAFHLGSPLFDCLYALEEDSTISYPLVGRLTRPQALAKLHEIVNQLAENAQKPPLSAEDKRQLELAKNLLRQARAEMAKGDYPQVEGLIGQALMLQETVLGKNHLDHCSLLLILAEAKEKQGQPTAVLPLIQRYVDIHVAVLGETHPETLLAKTQLMTRTTYEYGLGASAPFIQQAIEAMGGANNPFGKILEGLGDLFKGVFDGQTVEAENRQSRSQKVEQALGEIPPEREAILAGLDDINWHALHHAYGTADDVPRLLRLLLSEDQTARETAWEALWGNIFHQGTVYEATPYTVPFFIRMLAAENFPDKGAVVMFLATIAKPYDEDDDYEEEEGVVGDDEVIQAIQREVGKGLPVYLNLLEADDSDLHHPVLDLLATQTHQKDLLIPRLQALFRSSSDLRERSFYTLCELMDDSQTSQAFFESVLTDETLKFMAAYELLKRARVTTPPAAIQVILGQLRQWGQNPLKRIGDLFKPADLLQFWKLRTTLEDKFQDFAASENANMYSQMGIQALRHLGDETALKLISEVLPDLRNPDQARFAAQILLDMVFGLDSHQVGFTTSHSAEGISYDYQHYGAYGRQTAPRRTQASLTPAQQQAVKLLYDHAPLWETNHNLLGVYGLPATRSELGQWLKGV